MTREPPIETYVLIKKFTFFGGFSMGLASGDIQREADVVPSVQSSAVYLGVKVGADFPLSTGWVLRPEISYATSPVASTISPAALTELSVQCGIYLSL